VRQALRQTGPSPEIDGAPELGSDDWEVDDEGRISDARHQRIRASMRAHLEQWNRHFTAGIFADIEVVARERSDDDARQILGDIRLIRGAVGLGDARLAAELAFRVGARAQAADLMPDAKRYRAVRARSRKNLARHNANLRAGAQQVWAPRQDAYRALRAAGWTVSEARQEIAGRISEEGRETPDDKTLRKWLRG